MESLLESMNHVKILESGIITPTIILVNLVILRILQITSSGCPYLESPESIQESRNQVKILNHVNEIQSCRPLKLYWLYI